MKYLLKNVLRSIYLYIKNPKEREFQRLFDKWGEVKRYERIKNVKFLDYVFDVPDLLSFIWQFKEIFVDEIYKFESKTDMPLIYDCGANIGVSCLYFKKLFPKAKIKAFEADPLLASILKNNLLKNGINDDVEIINKAIWINNNGVEFGSDGADGGSVYMSNNKTKLESISLKELLEKEEIIDLIKIDIEGAEYDVLLDCKDVIDRVNYLFVEYHSWNNTNQKLSKILEALEENGFRYYMENASERKKPFVNKDRDKNMDLQLNIFGYK